MATLMAHELEAELANICAKSKISSLLQVSYFFNDQSSSMVIHRHMFFKISSKTFKLLSVRTLTFTKT